VRCNLGERGRFRIIVGILVALVGLIGYYTNTQVNPVTGEKQRVAMNVAQERALGLQAAPQMAAQMGGVLNPATNPRAALVAEVGSKLVRASSAGRSPYVDNFHFFLLKDSETINAFALPGGQVFITQGLLQRLGDEAQLAGVLGHEIGHVVHRHAAEHMATGRLGEMLSQAVGVASEDGSGRGVGAQMAAAMVNQMVQLKYSRGDESESDRYGLEAMAAAGYDPSAMLEVMRVLREASKGQRQPEMLASHPLPDTRLRELEDRIKQTYPNGVPPNLTRGRPLNL
jgi:predicted Zn-dependent protease